MPSVIPLEKVIFLLSQQVYTTVQLLTFTLASTLILIINFLALSAEAGLLF